MFLVGYTSNINVKAAISLWYLGLDSSAAGRYWASQPLAGKNSASTCPKNTSLNPTYRSFKFLSQTMTLSQTSFWGLPTVRSSIWSVVQQRRLGTACGYPNKDVCITEVIIWKGCWSLRDRVSTKGAMLSGRANRCLSSPQVAAGRCLPFSTCPACFLLPGQSASLLKVL